MCGGCSFCDFFKKSCKKHEANHETQGRKKSWQGTFLEGISQRSKMGLPFGVSSAVLALKTPVVVNQTQPVESSGPPNSELELRTRMESRELYGFAGMASVR
jgi:hypothetical protein